MDVTALLNQSSTAVDQQKPVNEETYRLPTRNRTPWDAGGYSLPLNITATAQSPPTLQLREAGYMESDVTPTNPSSTMRPFSATFNSAFHKVSDSRSSLSSFASSTLHSTNHSRYSSISTLNSPRSLSMSLSEQLMLSPKAQGETGERSYFRTDDITNGQMCMSQQQSPNRPLDALAQIVENRSLEDLSSSSPNLQIEKGEVSSTTNQLEETNQKPWRPSHNRSVSSTGANESMNLPDMSVWKSIEADQHESRHRSIRSDNVFAEGISNHIRRPCSPSDTLLIKRSAFGTSMLNEENTKGRLPSEQLQIPSRRPIRSHKRALSAPDFAILDVRTHRPIPHEPTPPGSHGLSHETVQSIYQQSPPATPPPVASTHVAHAEPTCMYIDDCDTDSPQRKAISHIFGRNKMCTRMIPEHLWVHLCRKHYQRCRYRDQNKWAKVQCDLVQLQIRRIHDWSLENQFDPHGIRLVGWSLTMRKREKVRREKAALAKRKRDEDGDFDDKVEERDRIDLDFHAVQTQVPDWLVKHCDQEFNTQGILAVFNRLHQEVLDGRVGPQFPDIELLPNLVSPEDFPKPKKSAVTGARKSHQRSQSMITPGSHESTFRDHTQKRQRREDGFPERALHSLPVRQMGRQPTYPSFHEEFESGYGPQIIAHQPQPRRFEDKSIAAKLEGDNHRNPSRPNHQRSQSDAFFYDHSTYARTSVTPQGGSRFQSFSARGSPKHMQQFDGCIHHEDYDNGRRDLRQETAHSTQRSSSSNQMMANYERGSLSFGHHRHTSTPAYSEYPQAPQHRYAGSPFGLRESHNRMSHEQRDSDQYYARS